MTQPATPPAPRHRLPAKEGLPATQGLRKLHAGERVAHWVKGHLGQMEAWNQQGWRWAQIAQAVGQHIDRPVTRNKLTGMVTMIRKGRLARDVDPAPATEASPAERSN